MAGMCRDDRMPKMRKRQHSGPTFEQARASAIALKEGWVTDDEDGAAPAAHGGSAADVATDSDNVKEFAAALRHTLDCSTDESEDIKDVKEDVVHAMKAVACAKEAVVNANNALIVANNALKRMTFYLNIPPPGNPLFD